MDSIRTSTPSCTQEADIAAATAHLKESWEHGKDALRDTQHIAQKSLSDVSRSIDEYFEARPKAIALWALGTGLAVGLLTGLLVSRAARAPSSPA
jgi:ElaB/YqjD/DUF883 family membrane-anchored ribosome-binding protein